MQIPMIITYHKIFEDVPTFHIWGTVAMNQAFNYKKTLSNVKSNKLILQNYVRFTKSIIDNEGSVLLV